MDDAYVYIRSEPGLWTVGHYDPGNNKFMPESDHGSDLKAAERARYLNGDHTKRQLAADDMHGALLFVKEFFRKLEDGSEPNDPLHALRKKFHAPVHKVIDEALKKAGG